MAVPGSGWGQQSEKDTRPNELIGGVNLNPTPAPPAVERPGASAWTAAYIAGVHADRASAPATGRLLRRAAAVTIAALAVRIVLLQLGDPLHLLGAVLVTIGALGLAACLILWRSYWTRRRGTSALLEGPVTLPDPPPSGRGP